VSIPTNSALLVQKRSASAGARNRGRFFFPPFGVADNHVDHNGMHSTTQYNALDARLQVWFDLVSQGDFQPVLFHSDGGTPTPITSFVLDPQIATQRRRMR
jgi:hypothetical protein